MDTPISSFLILSDKSQDSQYPTMRINSILSIACILLFFCCNSSKDRPVLKELQVERVAPPADNWDGFWKMFTTAVNHGDAEKVSGMIRWPLFTNMEENSISKQQLKGKFNDIFDEETKATFSALTDRDIQIVPSNEETAGFMNTPKGIELKSINVMYVEDEGKESQTESSKTFVFGEINGQYKLLALIIAG